MVPIGKTETGTMQLKSEPIDETVFSCDAGGTPTFCDGRVAATRSGDCIVPVKGRIASIAGFWLAASGKLR